MHYDIRVKLGKSLTGLDEIVAKARRIQQQGVNYVYVSQGQDSALLVGPDNTGRRFAIGRGAASNECAKTDRHRKDDGRRRQGPVGDG